MRNSSSPVFALVSRDQNHMATTFELKVASSDERSARAARLLEECHALIETLEAELTEFRPESPVARLNAAPPRERVVLPASAWELLELSMRLEDLSGGAFSTLAKSSGPEPKSAKARLGLDSGSHAAWRLDADAHLGFGAIGKGYALDRCRALIALAGYDEYCLSGGGSSILLSGYGPGGRPWNWGWSWAKGESGEALGLEFEHVKGSPIAIGVSGLHEKGLHLIDPRALGAQAQNTRAQGLRSALVAHPSAAWADALSTALFVAGWDAAFERFSHSLQSPAIASIDLAGVPRWNGPFQALWGAVSSG